MSVGNLSILPLFFFFLVGTLLPDSVLNAVGRVKMFNMVMILAGRVMLAIFSCFSGVSVPPMVSFLVDVFGLLAGICLGIVLAHVKLLNRLGSQTLQI